MPSFRTFPNTVEALRQANELASYLHPDYVYYRVDWQLIRDCLAGERRIKELGTTYLPGLDTDYGTTYETYKERASFVNMTARTLNGLVGTIWRKPVKVVNNDKEDTPLDDDALRNVTLGGMDFNLYAKKLAYELIGLGRVGILVDMPQNDGTSTGDQPYMIEYVAENVLSWHTQVIDGREVLTYVLLREIVDGSMRLDKQDFISANPNAPAHVLTARYRVLLLDEGVYKQRLYSLDKKELINPSFFGAQYDEIIPTKNGKAFDFIPMVIIGPLSPTPEIQKSPLLDIATLNISHYRTSAQLEHGRYNTALPVYYVNVPQTGDQGEYILGPAVVWELPLESRAGILEYHGIGLNSLVAGLTEKEEHIAELGGRILGIRPQAQSDSPDTYRLKQQQEVSILVNVTDTMAAGLTKVLTWYLDWARMLPPGGVRVRLNQDFKQPLAARELRAIAVLYQANMLPIQDMYRILLDSGFLDQETTQEEFVQRLEDATNFPNQPDIDAMSEGFSNAADRTKYDIAKGQQDILQEQVDIQGKTADAQIEAQKKSIVNNRINQQQQPQDPNSVEGQMFTSSRRTQQFGAQPQAAPKAASKGKGAAAPKVGKGKAKK